MPHSTDRLGRDGIVKLLIEFSVPAIMAMLVSQLYNLIDAAVLGAFVGPSGVAVATVVLPVMMFTMGVSMLAGVGGNALSAISLGSGDKDSVEETMGQTANLLFTISFVFMVFGCIFIEPLLDLIGTQDAIRPETKLFVLILVIGCPIQSVGAGLNNFLRTAGKPGLSMGVTIFSTVVCAVLNLVFVALMGMGVAGSALATIIGQSVICVPIIYYFVFDKTAPFYLRWRYIRKFNFPLMGKIIMLGMASFIMQIASTIMSTVFNHVVGIWGAMDTIGAVDGLAAIGVANRAGMVGICFFIGVTMGMQPIAGFNFGAKKWDRVIKTLAYGMIMSALFGVFIWIVFRLFPEPIVVALGAHGEIAGFASSALLLYTIFYPIVGAQIAGASYFQSSGQPVKAAILELIRQVGFLIPLYLTMPGFFSEWFNVSPLTGVVLCNPVSDIMATVVTSSFLIYEFRKLFRLRREAAQMATLAPADE